MTEKVIYFDNSATTEPCAAAIEAFVGECRGYANPSSLHRLGFEAEKRLSSYRSKIAATVGCSAQEIIFTSGGTESNNLAVRGAVEKNRRRGNRIITTDSEHPSVSEPIAFYEKAGFEVVRIGTRSGVLDLDAVRAAANDKVIFASFMHTNNETGAIYDVASASMIIKSASPNAIVHSDCVQGYLKGEISLSSLGADLISLSAHKIHAPKGSGALVVRRGIKLVPVALGGGQEGALRSGTEAMPSIAAFAAAAEAGYTDLDSGLSLMSGIKSRIIELLKDEERVSFNLPERSSPHILSLSVKDERSEVLLHKLSDMNVFVSSGSACSSKKGKSPVLKAFGLSDRVADSTVRLSFGFNNTLDEADAFCEALRTILKK